MQSGSDGSQPFSQIFWRDLSSLQRSLISTAVISSLSYHNDPLSLPPFLHHSEDGGERKLNKRGENWIFFISFQNEFDDVREGEGIKYISYISYDYHQCLFLQDRVPAVQSIYITKEGRKDCCDLAGLQISWEWRQVKERVGCRVAILNVASLQLLGTSPRRTQIFPEFRTKHFKHFSFRILYIVCASNMTLFLNRYFRWVLILKIECTEELLILNEM